MIPVLGIDPGHEGAAVLLAPNVCFVAWWRRLERKACDVYLVTGSTELASLHQVGDWLLLQCDELGIDMYQLVFEGLFAWRAQINGLIGLAEGAGELLGPLRDRAIRVERPRAVTWRSEVLPRGWGKTSEEAERAALAVCCATMPGLGPYLQATRDDEGRLVPTWPHVLEAACMARWGLAQQRLAGVKR